MAENHKHFEGKEAAEHLRAARAKGAKATAEVHGTEMPGYLSAFADSLRETSVLLIGMWILLSQFGLSSTKTLWVLGLFSIGWLFWKVGRSSLLGWARLERLHRLIQQEQWEIEHHRAQEKEELTAMYQQKGLSGKLLEQVVEVLMADDNRLLRVMLEEELGLTLETYEHPLKQAAGAGLGVIIGWATPCTRKVKVAKKSTFAASGIEAEVKCFRNIVSLVGKNGAIVINADVLCL